MQESRLIKEAFKNNKELDFSKFTVEVRDMSLGTVGVAKSTYGDYIIKKLPSVSKLYASCHKVPLESAKNIVAIQKNKIGKLVKMKELQDYVAQNADYDAVIMKPHKFGTMFVISEELAEDAGYNIKEDLKEQTLEAYGELLDELCIMGDKELEVEGLNDFDKATGAKEATQITTGKVSVDDLMNVYHAVPKQYRKKGTWIFNDATSLEIAKLKDADGRPLMMPSYNTTPFGEDYLLLGRPVIINDHVTGLNEEGKAIFFGDLEKAYAVCPRKSLTLKSSSEYGFLNDSEATKVNVRVDAKKMLEEAMAYLKTV